MTLVVSSDNILSKRNTLLCRQDSYVCPLQIFARLPLPSTSYTFVVFSLIVTPFSAANNISLVNMTSMKTECFTISRAAVQHVTELSSVFGMSQAQISTRRLPVLTEVVLWLFLIP
jgi:hypothetical protein